MDPVYLTRAQWNAIWSAASQARSSASDIDIVQHSLRDVGLDKPADRMLRAVGEIADSVSAIQRALIDAEEAMDDMRQVVAVISKNLKGEA